MSAVDDFLSHLQVERRMSAHTLDAYRRDLDSLQAWTTGQGVGDLATLDAEQLRAFIAAEHRRGLSPKSLQRRLSACRSFYAWLLKHGRIAANPVAGIRAPKAPRKLPQVLDADEAMQLVEVPTDAPLGLRDRALLELFYSSGLRLSELCALRWNDLDLDGGFVSVVGKGNKQRIVPVGSHARAALLAWRDEQKPEANAPVFPGRGGAPISQRAIQIRIKQLAQRQGLFKHVHPHMLRHSFASHILESSGDLRGVQELLGHADISTTQIYTHLDFQHLAKVYDAAHPRAKRKT
jgi:integrase/recombinase XerC